MLFDQASKTTGLHPYLDTPFHRLQLVVHSRAEVVHLLRAATQIEVLIKLSFLEDNMIFLGQIQAASLRDGVMPARGPLSSR